MEATAEVSKTFNEKIRRYCDMTLLSCAYAGTGNVLKVFYCTIYNMSFSYMHKVAFNCLSV